MLAAIERLRRYDATVDAKQIAQAIQNGSAIIMLHDDGFTVLTTPNNDTLHVWIGCSYTGRTPTVGSVFDELADYADSLGLRKMTFDSPRKGWHKVHQRFGFETNNGYNYVRYV